MFIEVVNLIKLCFCVYVNICCMVIYNWGVVVFNKYRWIGLFGDEGIGVEDEGKKLICFYVIDLCG